MLYWLKFHLSQSWLEIDTKCGTDTTSTILGRQLLTTTPFASYALTAGNVSGVVPIANGGTGSSTQNFVDLTSNQTIAGTKTFSSPPNFTATGYQPFYVSSAYDVANLNADYLDGQHSTAFQNRVSGVCAVGSSIRAIHADGTVECDQPVTFYYPLMMIQNLNTSSADSGLKGFVGGFTDGRYGYLVPNNNGSLSGKVARVDLINFTTSGVTSLDLASVDSGLAGFYGGFTDGRYGYFVPYTTLGSPSGVVQRIQLFSGVGAP